MKQNISKNERKMIPSLAKRKNLMVLPTDKGKAEVIMDTEEYMAKFMVILSDERA